MRNLCEKCSDRSCRGEKALSTQYGKVITCEHFSELSLCAYCEYKIQCVSASPDKSSCREFRRAEKCSCGVGNLIKDGRCRTCDACGMSCCG